MNYYREDRMWGDLDLDFVQGKNDDGLDQGSYNGDGENWVYFGHF